MTSDTPDYAGLCERLRELLVIVPAPDSQPFHPLGAVEMIIGGGPYKPGDSAGLQTVSNYSTGGHVSWMVQQHIYAGEPLAYAAADAIEALLARLENARGQLADASGSLEQALAREAALIERVKELEVLNAGNRELYFNAGYERDAIRDERDALIAELAKGKANE